MANRLASQTSPYLLQHADNPVDWYPWGPEAFEEARRSDRPVLLSIGYSACHWCHVMAEESFEDPGIARAMNERFVCVKVDREERPDVDQLYQGCALLAGKGGGWPLTVFLSPDGKPFFAGTYFPPRDRLGIPGFPRVLLSVDDAWKNRRRELLESAQEMERGLRMLSLHGVAPQPKELSAVDLAAAGVALAQEIDPVHGGFGDAPKFPNPDTLLLMLRSHRRGAKDVLPPLLHTLEAMARGGVYDQLGGGFHRYSVDEGWQVPHFEKMLYDNALLLRLYAEAFQLSRRPEQRRVAEQTVAWLEREMTSPEGGFYSSQDADSEGEEGRFFVWTPKEIAAVCGPSAPLLCQHLGIDEGGNFEGGRTVLSIVRDAEELAEEHGIPVEQIEAELERGKAALMAAREKRPRPSRDDKILAGWNGLMIGALAKASRAFARPEWAQLAARAADFVLGNLAQDGKLLRSWRSGKASIAGMLEDHGNLCEGLVELYGATLEPRYLEAAATLTERGLEQFWEPSASAFLAAPRGGEKLAVPVYAIHDNAWPSGASTLCAALVALSGLLSRPRYLEIVGDYLSHLSASMTGNPFGFGHLWCAADAWLDGAATLVLAGEESQVRRALEELDRRWAPTLSVAWSATDKPVPQLLRPTLEGKSPLDGMATSYLCRNQTCQPPRTGALELGELAGAAS